MCHCAPLHANVVCARILHAVLLGRVVRGPHVHSPKGLEALWLRGHACADLVRLDVRVLSYVDVTIVLQNPQ